MMLYVYHFSCLLYTAKQSEAHREKTKVKYVTLPYKLIGLLHLVNSSMYQFFNPQRSALPRKPVKLAARRF